MRRIYRQINGKLVEVKRQPPGPKVHIIGDIEPYRSPIDNRLITSRSSHRDDLKRNNCRVYEGRDQEVMEAQRHIAQEDAKFEEQIGERVEKTFHDLKEKQIEPVQEDTLPFTFGLD